jgi:tetratricopeptide (TPR) repeat protein
LPVYGEEEEFITTTIEDPVYWVTEGVKAYSIGDYNSALLMFNTAISLNPQYAPGWNWRSKALTELGNTKAASESLDVAKALEPEIQDPFRMRVGALADVKVTPIPTLRPIEKEDENEFLKSKVDTEKKPDPEGADIVLKDFSASVDERTNQLKLELTCANTGLQPTRFFYITYHISEFSRITGEDRSIGYYFVKNLRPGEEKTVSSYIPIGRIPAGDWYIAALADVAYNVIEQSKENNAIALKDQRLVVPVKAGTLGTGYLVSASGNPTRGLLPDLQIAELSAPDVMYIGKETKIETTIENRGTGNSGPFAMRLILSRDVWARDYVTLTQGEFSGLKAGMSIDGTATPTVPDMAPGYYYYGLILDPESNIAENDKANNLALSSVPIRVMREIQDIADASFVDLVVESISVPKTADLGEKVEVTAVLRNDGSIPSGVIVVGLYLSKDPIITESDILISYGQTDIPAGNTKTATSYPVIPVDITPGEWYIGIILEPHDIALERNIENNVLVASHRTAIS